MLHQRLGSAQLLMVAVIVVMGCAPDESIAPTPVVTQVPGRGPAASLVTPTPVDLGTIGGVVGQSVATGINDALQIVGWSESPSGVTHAFLWQGGVMQDLGTPNGQNSYATAINDAGRIVGYTDGPAGTQHPWAWTNGKYTFLPLAAGKSGRATALGPGLGGVIAGCMFTPSQANSSDIVKWNPAANPPFTRTSLGAYPLACATGVDVSAHITASRLDIAGAVWRAGKFRSFGPEFGIFGIDPSGSGAMAGWNWNFFAGVYFPNLDLGGIYYIDIVPDDCSGALFGLPVSKPLAVNAIGQMVGSWACSGTSLGGAFYWAAEGEGQFLLPVTPDLNGCCAVANALNLTGQVVGWSSVAPGVTHATLWGVVPEVTVLQLPPCSPRPCRIPPKVSYIPKKFINDGIITRPGFDATQLDPNSITLGDGLGHTTPVARTASGALMASVTDVDGDGVLDLKVSFSKSQLIADGVLTLTTRRLEVSAIEPTGLPWQGHYPVWVQ